MLIEYRPLFLQSGIGYSHYSMVIAVMAWLQQDYGIYNNRYNMLIAVIA